MIWRFLSHPPQSAEMNMAIDEAIAQHFSHGVVPPTFRIYRWSSPSFSIGSFQKLDPSFIDDLTTNAIPLVRRITGGRALLHDREVTYSVIAGTHDPLFSKGIQGTFYAIARGLLAGLERLGVEANIDAPSSRGNKNASPFCFASTSQYEVTAQGRKLIGSAQKRWATHFLQHGSLLLSRSTFAERFIPENQISLSSLLTKLPSDEDLVFALRKGIESALSVHLVSQSLTVEEEKMAADLIREKYGSPVWNLYRHTQDRNPSLSVPDGVTPSL